ncbi:MAG: FAD-binding oxidoreductase [Spirochaetia bacterium]|nr:FAD-binding oxidoreductase [Spirochaetia bacterium]
MKDPAWIKTPPPEKSFRSILKWGSPGEYKRPNKRLVKFLADFFSLREDFFQKPKSSGLDEISVKTSVKLNKKHLDYFQKLCGKENIKTDSYDRIKASYGKTMVDLMRLREKKIENLPDAVVSPKSKKEIEEIVKYCSKHKIPLYATGMRSSVTRGTEAVKGGISLDMTVHMNKIISFSETNQTITVEAGITGPMLEEALNNAHNKFKAKRRYTCGHFPQSFEYSTVGGWIVTLGSGQQSTYYGDARDLVISQEYVTPAGNISTKNFPAEACGPSINYFMPGSEGAFGILVSVVLKVFRYMPENRRYFTYIFKDFKNAISAGREIMQSENGIPSAFRISDSEETEAGFKLYGIPDIVIDKVLPFLGFKKNKRSILLGFTDGGGQYSKLAAKNIKKICGRYKALSITGYAAKKWEKGRFKDPYMRDDLQDFGIIMDTLECSVTWENISEVYSAIRAFGKSRPQTMVMMHMSHFYSQGTNLYIIFTGIFKDISEFSKYQMGIIKTIKDSGASLSHHHGIGKLIAPFFEDYTGKTEMGLLRAAKKYLDSNNILNPGGTLALDIEKKRQKRKL